MDAKRYFMPDPPPPARPAVPKRLLRHVVRPQPERPPRTIVLRGVGRIADDGRPLFPEEEPQGEGRWTRKTLLRECDGDEAKAEVLDRIIHLPMVPPWDWHYLTPDRNLKPLVDEKERARHPGLRGRVVAAGGPRRLRGQWAGLTTADQQRMRERHAQGDTYAKIASDLGVSLHTVAYWMQKRVDSR